jgi:flagellar biosynthesis protein FliP
MTLITIGMYVKCNLWIPQIPVQIVAPCTKLYTIYGNRMWYVKILIIDIILYVYVWFLLLNTFFCKTPKLYVVLRIRERAMATVQNPTKGVHRRLGTSLSLALPIDINVAWCAWI